MVGLFLVGAMCHLVGEVKFFANPGHCRTDGGSQDESDSFQANRTTVVVSMILLLRFHIPDTAVYSYSIRCLKDASHDLNISRGLRHCVVLFN